MKKVVLNRVTRIKVINIYNIKRHKEKRKMNETIYERMSTVAARDALKGIKSTNVEDTELYEVCYAYWMNNLDMAKRAAK